MLRIVAEILAVGTLLVVLGCLFLIARSWRVEATLKSATHASTISLAAGFSFAGLSASAAAILDGPGVIAVHLRARELWKRPIERVSIEAVLLWLDEQIASKPDTTPTRKQRIASWLRKRTDINALPDLGIRILTDLRSVSLRGAVVCGFADPALTGKTAAWLFPLAGVLAPLGEIDVSFDWSGRTIVDVDVEASCRVVPVRVMFESLRFVRHHVHFLKRHALVRNESTAAS